MAVSSAGVDLLRVRVHAHRELPDPAGRRAARENAGIAVRELAEALGVSRQCVAQWEAGSRVPRGELLVRYVEALKIMQEAGE